MKKKLIFILSAALIIVATGCSKDYLDINNNPNSATNTTPELVLPQALTVTASRELVAGFMPSVQCWMGYWAISGSYASSNGDPASYFQTTDFGDATFQAYYHNLADYNYIEQTALAENKPFYVGVAKIMKAYDFQRLVDMFGNIPYSQAFQGTNFIQPKYDSASVIYASISSQLDSAITYLSEASAAGEATATSDIMFGGDNTQWITFANTLHMRILMRESQVSGGPTNLNNELAQISANGYGFLTNDAGVNPGYANNSGQQSPVWGFFVTLTNQQTTGGSADFYRANQYAISWLQNNNDTARLKYIYSPGGTGFIPAITLDSTNAGAYPSSQYIGNVLGAGNAALGGNGASSVGPGILKSVSQPAILISAAESYFLQAEAALRGWAGFSDANDLFISGVTASFNYLGAETVTKIQSVVTGLDSTTSVLSPSQSAAAYTSQANNMTNYSACTGFNQQLACIIRQKWVAMDEITPFEAYCDYRRLGLPADIATAAHSISPYIDNPPTIPIRILYPTSEYSTNAANVTAQGTINGHTSPIFWEQ